MRIRGTDPWVQVTGLFILFYSYVLLRIRPELFYQQNPAVFLLDTGFFAGFLNRPGGLVEYAAAFLSALFASAWLGALVLTLLTLLLCLATRQYLRAVGGTGGTIVFLLPAILILTVLGQYSEVVRLCVGLLVALVAAAVQVRLVRRAAAMRLTAFLFASALVYYTAAGALWVFACLCAVYEFATQRHRWPGISCLLAALAVPASTGRWLCDLSLQQAFWEWTDPFGRHWLAGPTSVPVTLTLRAALVLFFPLAALAVAWRRRRAAASAAKPADQGSREPPFRPGEDAFPRVPDSLKKMWDAVARLPAGIRASLVLVALGIGADLVLFDAPKQRLLRMDYCLEHGLWIDALAQVRGIPLTHPRALDLRTVAHINRALHFHGGLLDKMFAYPQKMHAETLGLTQRSVETMAQMSPEQASDILFDLGRINESEHMAYEALELFGNRPAILKRLVYIHAIKGEPEAARKFLAVLDRSLWHCQWAVDCRRQLDADPRLSGVPVVASRQELRVVRDAVNEVEHFESMLQELLARNRRNRMAFEYLMAHYLLTGQLNKLAANLRRLDDFDYPRLPRYLEEALVIHLEATHAPEPDLGKRAIHPETRRRANDFLRFLDQYQGNTSAAFLALYPHFGDSYFFCYVFGNNCLPPAEPSPSK